MPSSPVTLALDACTEACSVALQVGDRALTRHKVVPRGHARELLPMIDSLLLESGLQRGDIGLLVYGRGPGAFTGVRISVSVAQGLASGLGCPLVGVSTLLAVAETAADDTGASRVAVAMDARMGEVYWVPCQRRAGDTLFRALTAEQVIPPGRAALPTDWSDWLAAGTGWAAHGEALRQAIGRAPMEMASTALPDARYLLPHGLAGWRRGAVQTASEAQPVYLRDRVTG